MKCIHCNNELEKGYLYISAAGSIPCTIIEWFSDQKQSKGIFGINKRVKLSIIDKRNGKFPHSYYCQKCKKIFGEFDV